MKKSKVGRPKAKPSNKKPRMVYITDRAYAFYKKIGEGNFSKGVMMSFAKFKRLA